MKVREEALYGCIKCSGDRFYHFVVAEKARAAWIDERACRRRKKRDPIARLNGHRSGPVVK
jgi:hypothetical protein